ncbi:MAG: dihydrofolate reductase [Proteobacteria bacterium]|nr:dihydrofolate reductase [Pseudomonadota bacterium]
MIRHIPEELRLFREKTLGHVIVMGRKTHESIGKRALPDRTNIVLTTQNDYTATGCLVFRDPLPIIEEYKFTWEKCFIIGGVDIYRIFLPYADKIHITKLETSFEGDTRLPFKWSGITDSYRQVTVQAYGGDLPWRHHVYERFAAT